MVGNWDLRGGPGDEHSATSPRSDQLSQQMRDGAQTEQRVEIQLHDRSLIKDVQNQFRQRISLLQ